MYLFYSTSSLIISKFLMLFMLSIALHVLSYYHNSLLLSFHTYTLLK